MLIRSDNQDGFIEILPSHERQRYAVTGSVDGRVLKNENVEFESPEKFSSNLNQLETSGAPATLAGSDQFRLSFTMDEETGGTWVEFEINTLLRCRAMRNGALRPGKAHLSGGFPINRDTVSKLTGRFGAFFENHAARPLSFANQRER